MKTHRTPNTIHQTLSVVLATRNEETNIRDCLESVKGIADEIIVVDEDSSDRTREIAKKFGANVYKVKHEPIFHETKQKAINRATGEWILQLDADERVTDELAKEINEVVSSTNEKLRNRTIEELKKLKNTVHRSLTTKQIDLFIRHQRLIEEREGYLGKKSNEVVAFFIPRLNFFLGKPLIHAGVYPDANIRLIKRGCAHFPAKSVHEQMVIDGEVAWLFNDLLHYDSPTLKRYLERMNRYTDLHSKELQNTKTPKNLLYFFLYTFHRPLYTFLNLYIRHLGFLDGIRGFLWSIFSGLHFPLAYYKYWTHKLK